MNYQKTYDNLISSRMNLKKIRHLARKNGEYFEGHHIIPKSKGGTGCSFNGLNNSNIVYLTAREHFLAHWLLWKMYRDRPSALAFHKMMSNNKNQKRIVSSRGYEEARLAFSETNKGNKYGKRVAKRIMSEEQKMKLSKLMKGKRTGIDNYFFGKKHSQETKKIISEKAKLRNPTTPAKPKSVFKNGVFIGLFEKSQEIADYIKCSHSNVKNTLGGYQMTAMGYTIRYVEF